MTDNELDALRQSLRPNFSSKDTQKLNLVASQESQNIEVQQASPDMMMTTILLLLQEVRSIKASIEEMKETPIVSSDLTLNTIKEQQLALREGITLILAHLGYDNENQD